MLRREIIVFGFEILTKQKKYAVWPERKVF
jgi:hypothetical protein